VHPVYDLKPPGLQAEQLVSGHGFQTVAECGLERFEFRVTLHQCGETVHVLDHAVAQAGVIRDCGLKRGDLRVTLGNVRFQRRHFPGEFVSFRGLRVKRGLQFGGLVLCHVVPTFLYCVWFGTGCPVAGLLASGSSPTPVFTVSGVQDHPLRRLQVAARECGVQRDQTGALQLRQVHD